MTKSEIRNPKSERSPKSEFRAVAARPSGLRASGLGFLSDFELRISDFIVFICGFLVHRFGLMGPGLVYDVAGAIA